MRPPGRLQSFRRSSPRAVELLCSLDVVYSHFGTEGNFVPLSCALILRRAAPDPVGRSDPILMHANSQPCAPLLHRERKYWIEDFHLDGLCLDAVHAIKDDTRPELLDERRQRLRSRPPAGLSICCWRTKDNEPRRLTRSGGEPERYTAQWNDDMHHVLHVAATRESSGYYAAYGRTELSGKGPGGRLRLSGRDDALSWRAARRAKQGVAAGRLRLIHPESRPDRQSGVRRKVEQRLFRQKSSARSQASIFWLPQTPMIFMGEEWGATKPFSVLLRLQRKTWGRPSAKGRPEEFARFPEFADPERVAQIFRPDVRKTTFLPSTLDSEPRRRRSSGLLSCIARGATRKGSDLCCPPYRARRRGVRAGRTSGAGRVAGRRSSCFLWTPISLLNRVEVARRRGAKFSGAAVRPRAVLWTMGRALGEFKPA